MHCFKEQKTKKYRKSCTIQHLWDERYNRHYNFLDMRNVCLSLPKKLMEWCIHLNLMFMDPCIVVQFIQKDPTRCKSVSKFIIPYLYEAGHVSGDMPPIVRSLKLHWQPLVLHACRVVVCVVTGRCQAEYCCIWNSYCVLSVMFCCIGNQYHVVIMFTWFILVY